MKATEVCLRKCLKCGHTFRSSSPYNRFCSRCKYRRIPGCYSTYTVHSTSF